MSSPCTAPDILMAESDSASACVGGAPSVDEATLMGAVSATEGGAEAVDSSILLVARVVESWMQWQRRWRAQTRDAGGGSLDLTTQFLVIDAMETRCTALD